MCTVTWRPRPDGFELLANRDELRSRRRARPPEVRGRRGIRFLAPTDADAGGTWVAVSERGLALALVNRYDPVEAPAGGWLSRGQLVLELAPAATREAAVAELDRLPLARFRPFQLLALTPGEPPLLASWNGRRRELLEPRSPLTSSSLAGVEARRARERILAATLEGAGDPSAALLAFHASHEPARGPLSPCMHRPDAATVSLSRVAVAGDRVTFSYADGPPCRTGLGAPLVLERRPSRSRVVLEPSSGSVGGS